jgi:tRNA A-37 threonylcarbamoyl transferase component Bud32
VKACPKCGERFGDDRQFCFVDGSTLEALQDARLGTAIAGRYLLEDIIGEGGMATVYRARHKVNAEQIFAVKLMNSLLARDPIVRERFRREAKSAKKIAHPNIIEIFEEGDTGDGTAYMVMEYLDGSSLADIVSKGPIPVKRAVGLMIQMARGIARAHDLGVVHRDLKPENIFVCKRRTADDEGEGEDLVKLLDFGIALSKQDSRLTGTGELFGTPQYMAPERITSTEAGPPSDLYALGVIFFEMLTARLPFDAPDVATFFVRHIKDPPLPIRTIHPGTPESLADLIERLLAKDPKNRPVDAHKVAADLVDIAREIGAEVPVEPVLDVAASSRPAQLPSSEKGTRRWLRRADVFREMLDRAYGPKKAPADIAQRLVRVEELAKRVAELKARSVTEQAKLEDIARHGREGRLRLGNAVDALGADASRAREELRAAEEKMQTSRKRQDAARKKFLEVHKAITYWEGRSGFAEPYEDLMNAYRDAADVIEGWIAARKQDTDTERGLESHQQTVRDLEFQLMKLRESLAMHELDTEAEREAVQGLVGQITQEIDEAEEELVSLAASLVEPLRERPELTTLFRRLEAA